MRNFFGLVTELDKIEGIDRFRISSIEPNLLSDDIIEFAAKSKKFVPHFTFHCKWFRYSSSIHEEGMELSYTGIELPKLKSSFLIAVLELML